jgi:hypothetical protein
MVVLVPLEVYDFDVILQIDWLSIHDAKMDWYAKIMTFKVPNEDEVEFRGERNVVPNYIISTMTTRRLIRRWWHAYLTYVVDFKKTSKELVDIPIVK